MKAKNLLYGIALTMVCSFSYSQETAIKEKKMGDNGTPTFLLFNKDSAQYQKGEEDKIWKEYLGVSSFDKFEKVKSRTDKQGTEHLVFQQYYKETKVENATFRVHLKGGIVESVNGNFIKIDNLNINPALSGEEAVLIAIDNTKAKKYAWES